MYNPNLHTQSMFPAMHHSPAAKEDTGNSIAQAFMALTGVIAQPADDCLDAWKTSAAHKMHSQVAM